MSTYTLTVFDDDDVTPLFEVSTDPEHPHPYLKQLGEFSESSIELLQGKAHIGFGSVGIIDAVDEYGDRFMTAQLGHPSGFSALARRRARLVQDGSPDVVIMDGIISRILLEDNFAAYTLDIADIRDRGVKVPCFNRTNTCSILPRGVIDGYGQLPTGEYLIEPTVPLLARFEGDISGGTFRFAGLAPVRERIATDKMRATLGANRVVMWRPAFGSDEWIEVRGNGPDFNLIRQTISGYGPVDVVDSVTVNQRGDLSETLPDNDDNVEVIVRYDGPVSEAYPFHFEGTWGDLVSGLLSGSFSFRDDGTQIDPRLPYNSTTLDAIDKPVRVRITKPLEDVRKALEQLCQQIGAAPALNDDGEIDPVVYALPPASDPLPQLDDSNCVAIAGWEHPTSNALTRTVVTYQRHRYVSPAADPEGKIAGGDGIAVLVQPIEHRVPDEVLAVMGEQDVLEVDLWAFCAIGGMDGQPITGDITDEMGDRVARQLAAQASDRFPYGSDRGFACLW